MNQQLEDMRTVENLLRRNLLARSKLARIGRNKNGATRYTCVECCAEYDDKEKMELHLCTHTNEYRFLCSMCGTGLKRKEHLERHTQEHMEVRPYVCRVCGKGFKRKEHLNIHFSIHKGNKTLGCTVCHKAFHRKDHLQKHMHTHNKHLLGQMLEGLDESEAITIKQEMEEDYLNPIITSVSGSVGQTEIKMEMNGSSPEYEEAQPIAPVDTVSDALYIKLRPHECPVCKKRYKRRDHLKVHSLTHLKRNKICSECGKAFHTEDQLLTHINIVHMRAYHLEGDQDGISRLKIMLGDKADSDGTDLLVPRSRAPDDRPHVCHICDRKFKRKQHLIVHGNVHRRMPQPTAWCSLCNQGFYTNDQFENHRCGTWENIAVDIKEDDSSGVSPMTNEQANGCPQDYVEIIDDDVSGSDYQADQGASISLSGQENEELEKGRGLDDLYDYEQVQVPVPKRVYVCKYCTKPFRRKDHFKIHLHIHTGVKSFFCPECGKGFYRKDHLQKHMQVHRKPKPRLRKQVPALYPINMHQNDVVPEITIHAPSSSKLRVPLQIKVPYQMVVSMENGEQRAVTIDPLGAKNN